MAKKKILTFEKLTEYDGFIKNLIGEKLTKLLASAKQYADAEINTQVENLTKGTTTVAKATTSADSGKLGGQSPSYYAKATDIPNGALAKLNLVTEGELDTALTNTLSSLSSAKHSHSNKTVLDKITSAKVSAWDSSEENAKQYTDEKIALIMENSSEAVDSIVELRNAMNANGDLIGSLTDIAATKVPTSRKINGKALSADITLSAADIGAAYENHSHTTDNITGLTSKLTELTNGLDAATTQGNALLNSLSLLEGKVGDGFEEITTAELQSLFQ